MKYEYLLYTWGGFYNDQHKAIHNKSCGAHYFDSKEDRDNYLAELKSIESQLNAKFLAYTEHEGYTVRVKTVMHRVIEYKGKRYHSTNDYGFCDDYSVAEYHMTNKWYLGFNDYPLGEDFDYENEDIKIIQEWIDGSFKPEREEL